MSLLIASNLYRREEESLLIVLVYVYCESCVIYLENPKKLE